MREWRSRGRPNRTATGSRSFRSLESQSDARADSWRICVRVRRRSGEKLPSADPCPATRFEAERPVGHGRLRQLSGWPLAQRLCVHLHGNQVVSMAGGKRFAESRVHLRTIGRQAGRFKKTCARSGFPTAPADGIGRSMTGWHRIPRSHHGHHLQRCFEPAPPAWPGKRPSIDPYAGG